MLKGTAPHANHAHVDGEGMRRIACLLLSAMVLTGCGAASETIASVVPGGATSGAEAGKTEVNGPDEDATALAERLGAKMKSATKMVAITEDNDPNDLIGRPNGYVSAAVIYDTGASCDELGSDCGAMIEVWPDETAAKARKKYIDGILESMPMLGQEYHSLRGAALLRINGTIKPSAAEAYISAFGGSTLQ